MSDRAARTGACPSLLYALMRQRRLDKFEYQLSPTAHREAETAKAHRG